MADTGQGATMTFATSALSLDYTSHGSVSFTLGRLDDTTLATTSFRTYVPSDLKDISETSSTFFFNPDDLDSLLTAVGVVQTITKTYPIPSGKNNGATLAGTGFITNVSDAETVVGDLMTASIGWTYDGKTDPAATDSST